MIKSDYQEEIESFKERMKDFAKRLIDAGEQVSPIIGFLVKSNEDGEMKDILSPIPHFMKDESSKEELSRIMPAVVNKITKEIGIPVCYGMISEGYGYLAEDQSEVKSCIKNWENLDKEEFLCICFETEFSGEMIMYPILRIGSSAILKDPISTTSIMKGRFLNVLRKKESLN